MIIAVGAFLGIYLRKAKKKLNNKLGIDENRNKEVETDDIVINESKIINEFSGRRFYTASFS